MPKVVIDAERCKGCGLCIAYCPPEVLGVAPHLNARGFAPAVLLDDARCTSCAVCAMVCPDAAVIVFKIPRARAQASA